MFYASVQYTVLKLDYQINATELAIRKTLGESMLSKNRRHFLGVAAAALVNWLLAWVLARKYGLLPLSAMAIPAVLFLLHVMLIAVMLRYVEKQKLIKILKGGAL